MRSALIVLLALFVLACLPAFAPNLRPRGVHAGLSGASASEECMDCHISEHDARLLAAPTSSPIVADWMVEEARRCVDCHRVHEGRGRQAVRDRLPALAEVRREH